MKLRNGSEFIPGKKKTLEAIDNNIVRYIGMHRLPSRKKTPFQELLDTIIKNNYELTEAQFTELFTNILSTPSLQNDEKMFSSDDSDIIDAYNDNSRRYFESLWARKIIDFFEAQNSASLKTFIIEMKAFLISQYTREHPYLKEWHAAQDGKQVTDDNLAHYALLRKNLIVLINHGHFNSNNILLDLFDLHYLTHSLARLDSYKTFHPTGYIKCYTENSHFYSNQKRGRVTGYGFNQDEPSYHLGIMRSIDKTPYDMRRPKLISSETRCPDRLYMSHPKEVRNDPQNWLHQAFSNPYNSLYVNGLSGSMLLEINAVLFFMKGIQTGLYKPSHLTNEQSHQEHFKLLKQYLLMISAVFIYFEGGHTLTEIMSVFYLEKVTNSIQTVLGEPKGTFSLHDFMLSCPEVYPLIKESLIDAAKYQARQDNVQRINDERLLNKFESIRVILRNFKQKIDSLEPQYFEAQKHATQLLCKLEQFRIEALKKPTDRALSDFRIKAHKEITNSMPLLQKELGWGDYLLNILQQITDILITVFSFGLCKNYSLFALPAPHEPELIAKELDKKLQL
ncbi:hypothetical protein [uncultured Legionella sp.]|uniref:hypothetical protein n=1 Tax=uncultured Legionella sp. TaxID=210934 RepID=UPI00261E25E9|nr:hypothetical protein [uncultured Legionella sp.]